MFLGNAGAAPSDLVVGGGYAAGHSDEQLAMLAQAVRAASEAIRAACSRVGLTYIDTGDDREKALGEALRQLIG
ncbi:MAG TPA: hypothetical protein VFH45_13460 [Acidimicrobiales bacterium]|nr:hypothetical protein [Acidimicrobiales bacterium]